MTFSVRAALSGFPPSAGLPSTTSLTFTDDDLAWALFVTGRAPGDEFRHGRSSVWEFRHRASLIPAYIRVTAEGRLGRSSLARDLDRSEKVNLSYCLGQAMAGVFASKVLCVGRLLHVDRYARHHSVAFAPGRQRPDLFGESSEGWTVIEAKGRSNAMEAALKAKLVAQKTMVHTIGGAPPWVAAGVVAEFPPELAAMRLRAVDPPEPAQHAQRWEVDPDRFAAAYYAPFLAALTAGAEIAEADHDLPEIRAVDLGAGVRVGLLQRIVDRLADSTEGNHAGLAADVDDILGSANSPAVRADGSFFETRWADAVRMTDIEG
jgi:hypothetical protein